MGLNTTPATWTPGQKVLAANLNTELRDALTGIQSAWTTFTPALTASGTAFSAGNAAFSGAYKQVGKDVHYRGIITMGSTTTYGTGSYTITLPVTAVNVFNMPGGGSVWIRDSSATMDYVAFPLPAGNTTTWQIRGAGGSNTALVGQTVPMTFASSDWIAWNFIYEAA